MSPEPTPATGFHPPPEPAPLHAHWSGAALAQTIGYCLVGTVLTGGALVAVWRGSWWTLPLKVLFALMLALVALVLVALVWQLLTVRGPVISLTRQGLRDQRVSPHFVPWSAIDFDCFSDQMHTTVIFSLDPWAGRRLKRTVLGAVWTGREQSRNTFIVSTVVTDVTGDAVSSAAGEHLRFDQWTRHQEVSAALAAARRHGDTTTAYEAVADALGRHKLTVAATALQDKCSTLRLLRITDAEGREWGLAYTHESLFAAAHPAAAAVEAWTARPSSVLRHFESIDGGLVINRGTPSETRLPSSLFQSLLERLDRL